MTSDTFQDIEKLETDLWAAADNLRANSKLTSSDYFMPVLGIIFLRHAANRFEVAHRQIEADQTGGTMPKRQVRPADYIARRSLYLPKKARYDWIMQQAAVSGVDLPKLVTEAMAAIESEFEPLLGVLPKDYGIFETTVLEDLMRLFNSEQIKQATGDVFGRIYEYFLAKFSIQEAHDNGEFFTPSSIVQTIVNVIEPDHGTVFDPACGSGGMFVQSSHFIEHEGGDTVKKVVFYGQEKNRDTIRIAKMNLAVHGLEGEDRRGYHLLPGRAHSRRHVRLRDGQSAVQCGPGGRRTHQGRPASALRPAGREQAEEGRQRQLSLDLLLLELPEPEGPRRLRDVLAGLDARGFAVADEFLRHAQRLQSVVHGDGRDEDDVDDLLALVLFVKNQPRRPRIIERHHRLAGGGAVARQALLDYVQEERLGGGDVAFDAGLPDRHALAEHGFVGRIVPSTTGAAARIAALPLAEPG